VVGCRSPKGLGTASSTIGPREEEEHMGLNRASKIAAGIVFILAALGVAAPVALVPIGLAVWVLGEAV
jgi:hypothetical protein